MEVREDCACVLCMCWGYGFRGGRNTYRSPWTASRRRRRRGEQTTKQHGGSFPLREKASFRSPIELGSEAVEGARERPGQKNIDGPIGRTVLFRGTLFEPWHRSEMSRESARSPIHGLSPGPSLTSPSTSTSTSTIVPHGFESTAHPIFNAWEAPRFDRRANDDDETPNERPGLDEEADDPPSPLPPKQPKRVRSENIDTCCPICLSDMSSDDIPVTTTDCLHSFCRTCLEKWLANADSCPLCKAQVKSFISANPADHDTWGQTLFTRPGASRNRHNIPGLSEAVEVQAVLHRQILEREPEASADGPGRQGDGSSDEDAQREDEGTGDEGRADDPSSPVRPRAVSMSEQLERIEIASAQD